MAKIEIEKEVLVNALNLIRTGVFPQVMYGDVRTIEDALFRTLSNSERPANENNMTVMNLEETE